MISKYYKSNRDKLIFPEYGRHIQKMADALMKIDDRDERTRQAHIVVDVMGNLNNVLRDTADFKHKLWDHLFMLSDYKLDVDFPYEKPTPENLNPKPEKLPYPNKLIGFKQYGRNIRDIISSIIKSDDTERKLEISSDILKFMKFKSYEYNQEFPSDEVIINDFNRFSNDTIEIDEDILQSTKIITKKRPQIAKKDQHQRPSSYRNNNNNNGGTQQRGKVRQMSGSLNNSKRFFRKDQ